MIALRGGGRFADPLYPCGVVLAQHLPVLAHGGDVENILLPPTPSVRLDQAQNQGRRERQQARSNQKSAHLRLPHLFPVDTEPLGPCDQERRLKFIGFANVFAPSMSLRDPVKHSGKGAGRERLRPFLRTSRPLVVKMPHLMS
jgi:hypothetical protein